MQRHEDLWYTMRYTNVCIMGITEKKSSGKCAKEIWSISYQIFIKNASTRLTISTNSKGDKCKMMHKETNCIFLKSRRKENSLWCVC